MRRRDVERTAIGGEPPAHRVAPRRPPKPKIVEVPKEKPKPRSRRKPVADPSE